MRALPAVMLLVAAPAIAEPGPAEKQAAAYVDRIAKLNHAGPKLNAVIAVDPSWRTQAQTLDAQARAVSTPGPIHGRAILIKDNIEVKGTLPTTAGSLALAANVTYRDAFVVTRLRASGAVILGKTNLSEWANIRSSRSISGWSAVGGLVRNPYALDRNACGSSSGSGAAVAAGLTWAAVGTETDGSVVCPASVNGIVGLKPTVGLVSRTHVVPISHSQDTPGPMARTVRDTAMMLTAMAGSDPADPATGEADAHRIDYSRALTGSIRGVSIGVVRPAPTTHAAIRALFDTAVAKLKAAGADIIDIGKIDVPEGLGEAETKVLRTELKVDLNAYLATTPKTVTTRTLAQLIAFNEANARREMPYFAQESFIAAEATKGLDDPDYIAARDKSRNGARMTLTKLFAEKNIAMIVMPTTGPAWLSDPVYGGGPTNAPSASQLPAVAGYPHLTVPMGTIRGLPLGLSFIGPAWSEAVLLNAGDVFEKVRGVLAPPRYLPTVPASFDPTK